MATPKEPRKRGRPRKAPDPKESPRPLEAPARSLRLGDFQPHPENPRLMTPAKHEALAGAMSAYGDLGGIVLNRRSGRIVGGHQRTQHLPQDRLIRWLRGRPDGEPETDGTVALGMLDADGKAWLVRLVDVDETTELAMNVAANGHSGAWDESSLVKILQVIERGGQDLKLTGFDDREIAALVKAAAPATAPGEFPGVDAATLPTEYRCPSCSYEWSGRPKPGEKDGDGATT